jgi:type I restriction enzyme, S subunit
MWATTTVQATFNLRDVARLPIPIPPTREREAIAHILGALDDKIELNRRMNETLEAMARAIFKSWFVDFDPVRAKLDGRKPAGMDSATAKLFPDGFEESDLGQIPRGWRPIRLGEVADVNWGDTSTTKASYTASGHTAYSASGPDGFLPYHDFDRTGVVLSAIGANCGMTWLALGKWSCIKNTIRFWNTDADLSTEFLFHATTGKDTWPVRGSAQPFISQGDSRLLCILRPSNGLGKRFGEVVHELYVAKQSYARQVQCLAEVRDTLLPKLLSGQIKVKDAEKKVGSVT